MKNSIFKIFFYVIPISLFFSCTTVKSTENTVKPSFDCSKAKSVAENLICSDRGLSELDSQFAIAFKLAKEASANSDEFKQNSKNAWIYREKNCKDKECLINWYESRNNYFKTLTRSGNSNTTIFTPLVNQANNFLIGLCISSQQEWMKYKCNSNLVSRSNEMAISVAFYDEKTMSAYVFFGAGCRNSPLPPSACKNNKYVAPVEYVFENDGSIRVNLFAQGCRVPTKYWMQNGVLFEGYAGEATGNCKQEQLIAVQILKQNGKNKIYYTRDLPF